MHRYRENLDISIISKTRSLEYCQGHLGQLSYFSVITTQEDMDQVMAASAAIAPLKRRSCDRCHGQKLRCPRRGLNNSDSCFRCLRLGVPCVYSVSLPKGRPSAHRRAGGTIVPVSCPLPLPTLPPEPTSSPLAHLVPGCDNDTSPNPSTISAASSNIPTAWPLLDDATFFQSPVQLDWGWSSNTPWSGSVDSLNLDPSTDLPLTNATQDTGTHGRGENDGMVTTLTAAANSFMSPADCASPLITEPSSPNHLESSAFRLARLSPPIDETEICIRKLSDLRAHLHPIYKASCSITSACHGNPGALLSAAAFDAVTVLLGEWPVVRAPVKDKCNLLYEIFSTSRNLLDIMYQLQATTTIASNTATAGGLQNGTTRSVTPGLMTTGAGDSGSHSIFVRCLVLHCYTRLLHIYSTLATMLHSDVSRVKVIESHSLPWLIEVRISLLMQFIMQLFDRLHQVMKAYFSQVEAVMDTARMAAARPTSDGLPNHSDDDLIGLDNVVALESIIRDKLKQLQTTLKS